MAKRISRAARNARKNVESIKCNECTCYKIDSFKFGIAGGIMCAVFAALITLAGIYQMSPVWAVIMLGTYGALGYTLSWTGILIGAVYAFIDGFIALWIFAGLYNLLIKKCCRKR